MPVLRMPRGTWAGVISVYGRAGGMTTYLNRQRAAQSKLPSTQSKTWLVVYGRRRWAREGDVRRTKKASLCLPIMTLKLICARCRLLRISISLWRLRLVQQPLVVRVGLCIVFLSDIFSLPHCSSLLASDLAASARGNLAVAWLKTGRGALALERACNSCAAGGDAYC